MMKKINWLDVLMSVAIVIFLAVGVLFAFDVPVAQGVTNFDSLTLSENLIVGGTAAITGATTQSSLTVTGATVLNGGLTMDTNKFTVADTSGNTAIAGTLGVTGASTLTGALAANGGITVDSTAFVVSDTSGNVSTAGTLGVTGASTLTGALAANGGITVDSTAFTVADTSGNVSTAGTLAVADKATFSGETVFASAEITPASGSSLTVAYTTYFINTSGAITMTLATTGATAGQIVILYGLDANNITINDTNLKSSDGNAIVLGQYDILILMFDGTSWVELSKSANS